MSDSNNKPVRIWATTHALTAGIREYVTRKIDDGMAVAIDPNGINGASFFHGEGRQWHRTREDAERRAEEMRRKKIASLKKQIAALEKLSFSTPTKDDR